MNKLTLIVFIIIFGMNFGFSQESILNQAISIKVNDKTVKEILDLISKKTDYYFTYDPNLISENEKLTFVKDQIPLETLLDELFSKNEIKYKLLEDHIVICKKNTDTEIYIEKQIVESLKYEISGKITDSKTKKPVPYVSIGIINTTLGVIANENGEFNIKVPKKYSDSSLYIAHIGYNNYSASVKNLIDRDNQIELDEDIISIQEVIIRNNDPYLLIQYAIKNKKKNYSQKTLILDAFYREAVLKRNSLLTLSEAVIEILKTPYKSTLATDKIRIDKSRKIINSKQIDTVIIKLKDGLYSGLSLDIMKDPIDFIDKMNMQYYNYQTVDIVSYNNKAAHVIEFQQKDNVSTSLYKGRLFIETESYALIGAEFEINFNKGNKLSDFVVKKHRKFIVKTVSAKYIVRYRQKNDQYILSHVRADLVFKVRKKRDLFSSKYKTFFETVIFNADGNNIEAFNKKEILKRNLIFIDNNFSYDAGFWDDKNFILPEKSIEEALKEIKVKLEYE